MVIFMITNHTIRNINNEDILFVYLNFDYEFGGFENLKKNAKDIKNNITNYLSNKKITFKGKVAVLIINGILIGTLALGPTTSIKAPEINPGYSYVTSIDFNIPEIQEQKESIIETETPKQEVIKEATTKSNLKTAKQISKQPEKETKQQNMITIKRSSGVTISIDLEEYLIGVVGSEMPASFHPEALKAQAVAARTYALKQVERGVTMTDTVRHQVYRDNNQLRQLWGTSYNTYYSKIKEAVTATKGKTITYNGEYIDAMYHSTNNGKTESSKDVFGNYYPYLVSVNSPWDKDATSYLREIEKNINEVNNTLNLGITDNTSIDIIERTDGGGIAVIKIDGHEYSGVELRHLLGIRSTDFDITIDGEIVKITTRGYGHGVGMSQYGANGMANAGYNYNQILSHYYKNTIIK